MKLYVSRLHYPVTVLGWGRRAGIWVQGCSVRCPGCIAQDTWLRRPGDASDTGTVLEWIESLPIESIDGITISGGEPFDQPSALAVLLAGLLEWRGRVGRHVDILCYSGHPFEELQRRHPAVLRMLDCIVPEPFVLDDPSEASLIGSANQRVVPLTELGRARYGIDLQPGRRQIQISADESNVWYIGIPARGDMVRVMEAMRSRGVDQGEISWRA
jgi:anaerobic ribonucleoside-triphosphate reductase activating protein